MVNHTISCFSENSNFFQQPFQHDRITIYLCQHTKQIKDSTQNNLQKIPRYTACYHSFIFPDFHRLPNFDHRDKKQMEYKTDTAEITVLLQPVRPASQTAEQTLSEVTPTSFRDKRFLPLQMVLQIQKSHIPFQEDTHCLSS